MKVEIMQWLEEWVVNNCDGDWEHSQGIQVSTLDNPGWSLSINLEGTILEEKHFEPIKIERSDTDWIHCNVQETTFRGFCGVRNMHELLLMFKRWTES